MEISLVEELVGSVLHDADRLQLPQDVQRKLIVERGDYDRLE